LIQGSKIQKFKNSKIQRFKDSKSIVGANNYSPLPFQRFKDSRIQRFKDSMDSHGFQAFSLTDREGHLRRAMPCAVAQRALPLENLDCSAKRLATPNRGAFTEPGIIFLTLNS
jgi:hypothetical protein